MDNLNKNDISLISKLVETPGVSGREARVAEVIHEALPATGWQIQTDPIGNLMARKIGPGKKVLLLAHMDEVGLIVQRITDDGFLMIERLGGMSMHTLPGNVLDLWTETGRLDALVGAEPAHLINGSTKVNSFGDFFVDIGAKSKADVYAMGVNIGDVLTWKSPLCLLADTRIRAKALDDRLGCFVLIKLAELLAKADLSADLTLGFVVQEETMVYEAAPIIQAIHPEVVIGIDGTLTFDTPDIRDQQSEICLGKGPCIKLMDAIRGKAAYLPNWNLAKSIISFMDEKGYTYQKEVVTGLSTALSMVPFMSQGIRTSCLSLPIRYHHSAVEVADLTDALQLIILLQDLLANCVLE